MKRLISFLACAGAVFTLASCGESQNLVTQEQVPRTDATGENWTVMIYMNGGSDESLYGEASEVLKNITEVEYPENLNVIIETGGSISWNTGGIDTNYIDRFEAQHGSLRLTERTESDSMAKTSVLTDFLKWGQENYEADHYALIVYGNGANSAYGFSHDETAGNESMNLQRTATAINNADMHFDIIGFDADLMASVENAALLSDYSDYLVASQETMVGSGWNYRDWFQYIIDNPTASVPDIASAACDTYIEQSKKSLDAGMATLSVTKLSSISTLSQAIDGMSGELSSSLESLPDYSQISIALGQTMCFGSNSSEEGYSNMTDLNDMAVKISSVTDKTSGRVQDELESAVIYRANGKYRSNACGLSIFYPYDQSSDELPRYMEISPLNRYKTFLAKICTNASHGDSVTASFENTQAFKDYNTERDLMQYTTVPGTTGIELNMTGNMDIVRLVEQRIFKKLDNGSFVYLGNASEIDENKAAGIYKTKNDFRFITINGHSVNVKTVYDCDDYTIYTIPLKIDSNQKNLRIVGEKKANGKVSFKSLGLRDSLGAGSKSSRHTESIKIYNLVTPIFKESDGELVYGDSFKTWPLGMFISEKSLPDGIYQTDYMVEYIYCNSFTTRTADFTVDKNSIIYN